MIFFEIKTQDAAVGGEVCFQEQKEQRHNNLSVVCLASLHVDSLTLSVSFPQGTLKDHFKKYDSGFDHVLESLKQNFLTFGKKKPDIYEVRNK